MKNFIIFYAPFVFLILSLVFAFWLGPKDDAVVQGRRKNVKKA